MKLMNESILNKYCFALFVFSLAGLCRAQNVARWTTLNSETKAFSVNVPKGYLVDKEDKQTTIYAFVDAASFQIVKETVKRPKSYVKEAYLPDDGRTSKGKIEIGDFIVEKVEVKLNGVYSTIIHAGSSNEYYAITASSDTETNPAVTMFLNSIRFEGKSIGTPSTSGTDVLDSSNSIDKLSTSPEVTDALNQTDGSLVKGRFAKINDNPTVDFAGYSRGLIILRKPKPPYTDEARMGNKQGTIKAKVEFLKNGQIGSIIVDDTTDRGLASNVDIAVMKIKFIPAEINGKPVDVTRIIKYSFSTY